MGKDIDKKIEELKNRNKNKYIFQGVAFNKNSPRQMELLKYALESSDSFSGLVKELLADRLDKGGIHSRGIAQRHVQQPERESKDNRDKDIGNFL